MKALNGEVVGELRSMQVRAKGDLHACEIWRASVTASWCDYLEFDAFTFNWREKSKGNLNQTYTVTHHVKS